MFEYRFYLLVFVEEGFVCIDVQDNVADSSHLIYLVDLAVSHIAILNTAIVQG